MLSGREEASEVTADEQEFMRAGAFARAAGLRDDLVGIVSNEQLEAYDAWKKAERAQRECAVMAGLDVTGVVYQCSYSILNY